MQIFPLTGNQLLTYSNIFLYSYVFIRGFIDLVFLEKYNKNMQELSESIQVHALGDYIVNTGEIILCLM